MLFWDSSPWKIAALISVILLISAAPVSMASAMSTFAMRVGGPGSDDVWRSVEQFSDGYIIAGSTDSAGAGNNDVWIIKLTELGTIQWQKTFGGKGGDTARMVKQTPDGGFVVSGSTHSFSNGRSDAWVLKFDSGGNLQWNKAYGGPGNEFAHAIDPTNDGGYIVAGYTSGFGAQYKDYLVVKTDAGGVVQWSKRFGGSGDDVIRYVKQTSDGNYLVAGFTHSFGTAGDIMIIKLDSNGDILWQKRYGGAKFEEPCCILEVPDGYIIMEQSTSFSKNTDGWIFKIDNSGNIVKQKRIGGGSFDEISAARMTPDGGFIVAAETKSFGSVNEDYWVIKFDAEWKVQWQKHYGGSGVDEPEAIALTPEGGALVVGTTRSFGAIGLDVWFLRLNSQGDIANCLPEVTVSPTTNSQYSDTAAVAQDVSVISADVAVLTKSGAVTGRLSDIKPAYQCNVDDFNVPPKSKDDSYILLEDDTLSVAAPGVLTNDIDLDGDTLTAVIDDEPDNGSVTLNADGSFEYTPDQDYNGPDSFTYHANDGQADGNIATVVITVDPVNDPPEAVGDSYVTPFETTLDIAAPGVLGNDSDVDEDALTAVIGTEPLYGSLTLNSDGSFSYAPDAGYSGPDSFTYAASDGTLQSLEVTVTIDVQAPPET